MTNSTSIGALIGLALCIVYLLLVLKHKNRKPDLTDIILVILSSVAVLSSLKLGYISITANSKYLGNLSDQRIAILLGSIAIIYVSISSVFKIFEPHLHRDMQE